MTIRHVRIFLRFSGVEIAAARFTRNYLRGLIVSDRLEASLTGKLTSSMFQAEYITTKKKTGLKETLTFEVVFLTGKVTFWMH